MDEDSLSTKTVDDSSWDYDNEKAKITIFPIISQLTDEQLQTLAVLIDSNDGTMALWDYIFEECYKRWPANG